MKYMKKAIVGWLAVILCLLSLTACGTTRVIFTTGFGKNEVFRIGDASCSRAEIMVYLTNTKNKYESVYGPKVWEISAEGVTLEENVKETVLARIAQVKTMFLLAQEKGVQLEEGEAEKIRQATEEYFASLNEAEIETMGVSSETIEKLYTEYALAGKVYREIIRDINPEISDDEARTITVQHIYIGEGEGAYERIAQILPLAKEEGRDFVDLATRYSEDANITYSFGKGEMDSAFEAAAFALETNEISDIVQSARGYHIIKCLSTFDREETDANKLEIVEERRREVFGQEYDAFVETLVRSLNEELWEKIAIPHDTQVTTSDFFDVYEKYFPE